MQNILVPVDLSKYSGRIFQFVDELNSLLNGQAKFTFIFVVEDNRKLLPGLLGGRDNKVERTRIEGAIKEQIREHVSKKLPSLNAKFAVVHAKTAIANEILNFAKSDNFTGIILATHGRTGVKRLLLGSVAERVLSQTILPVYVVPCREGSSATMVKSKRLINIVALTDFSLHEKKFFREVRNCYEAFNKHGASLNLVHIVEDILIASYHFTLGSSVEEIWAEREDVCLQKLEKVRDNYFFGKPVLTTAIRQSGSIADTAIAFATNHRASLLIAGKHQRKGREKWILGSVAEKLVRYSTRPTLIVPN